MTDVSDELYDVPLAEFVRRRNAVADRLRAAGKEREAEAVRAIAKPRRSVWGLNKVAREDRTAIERVVAAFDRLKRAHLRRPEDIGAAADALRAATAIVVEKAAAAISAAGGRGVDVDTHRRMATTVRGAAALARKDLLAGALTADISAPGFELFGDAVPRGRRRRAAVRAPAPRSDEGQIARDAMLRRRAAQLEEEALARTRDAERAAAGAFEARQRLRELESAAKAAGKAARKAQQLSENARRHASRAGRRRATG
jgi:hypothetical protein